MDKLFKKIESNLAPIEEKHDPSANNNENEEPKITNSRTDNTARNTEGEPFEMKDEPKTQPENNNNESNHENKEDEESILLKSVFFNFFFQIYLNLAKILLILNNNNELKLD